MRPNTPSGIATWMLEHLTFGKKNEALAGDLLEEFRRGRSAGWYWRQVLAAIVIGFAGELGTQWAALIYATLCSIPAPAYWMLALNKVMDNPFFAGRWHLEWPYSTICDLALFWGCQIIYIWGALILYFLLFSLAARTVNVHGLARSLWKSAFIFMAIYAGLIAFFALFPGHGVQGIDRRHITALSGITDPRFLVFRLPFFFTLFLSLWSTSGDKRPTRVVLT